MCLRACKHMLHDAAEWSGEIRQSHKRAASSPSERVKTCLRENTRMIKLGPRLTAGPQQLISPKTRQHDQHLLIVSNGPAAEDLGTSSAARQLLNIVLAVEDKIGRSLRLSGGGYYHPFVATELGE